VNINPFPEKLGMYYNELADVIERFIDGTSLTLEWDIYSLGKTYEDSFLVSVQQRMLSIPIEFPPASEREYTSPEGLMVLRKLVKELRSRASK
jgi:hypothetical protein